jgi:hypothetical protein
MVFVHARKETVKSATKLKEMALEEGMSTFFETREHPRFEFYRREISTSRNREMKELFDSGFGIHHAGMLRSDRNMMVTTGAQARVGERRVRFTDSVSRCSAVPRHWRGVLTFLLTRSSSRARKCMIVVEARSWISRYSMSFR